MAVGRWAFDAERNSPTREGSAVAGQVQRNTTRIQSSFAVLVIAQTAHSIEEYIGRLWELFPPATFLTGLVSANRKIGFLVINGALVAFGVWCYYWPVRRDWSSAATVICFWVLIETVNGVGHSAWSLFQGGYTPGVATAPLLLGLSVYLALQLRNNRLGRWC